MRFAAFALAAACAFAQSIALPPPSGKYRIGRTLMALTDDSRTDPVAEKEGAKREFLIMAWYPAEPDVRGEIRGQKSTWMPPAMAAAEADRLVGLVKSGPDPMSAADAKALIEAVQVYSVEDALVAKGRWPVILFAPDAGVFTTHYTSFMEDLASLGYIVFGMLPTGWVANAAFPDGHEVPASKKRSDEAAVPLWTGDMRYTLDQFLKWDLDPKHRFFKHADPKKAATLGHGLGGNAALQLALEDKRVLAAAVIDTAPAGPLENATLGKPLLVVKSPVSSKLDTLHRGGKPGYRMTLAKSKHMSFTDYPVMGRMASIARRDGIPEASDGDRIIGFTRSYVREFFSVHLRGKESRLIATPHQDENIGFAIEAPAK